MAPDIKVPANFGRKHISSPVHGNLLLKLKDGQEIKTNSMIMSLNSPVIDRLTTDLCQVKFLVEYWILRFDCLTYYIWPNSTNFSYQLLITSITTP